MSDLSSRSSYTLLASNTPRKRNKRITSACERCLLPVLGVVLGIMILGASLFYSSMASRLAQQSVRRAHIFGRRIYALSDSFRAAPGARGKLGPTLVLYVFSDSDPQYLDNLRYFIREGIAEDDGCDYVIVLNIDDDAQAPSLPPVPPNVVVWRHENACYDWGTFGWAIARLGNRLDLYRYFILMNSSVRGPYVPAYVQGTMHWSQAFLRKLSPAVKLVGPTISCQGSPRDDPGSGRTEWRRNPHVQSYLVATDRTGFNLLRADGNVFRCFANMTDTIWFSELGSSAVVLGAGFNIDSMMVRYQGVDWRDQGNWGCNMGTNPYSDHGVDGVNTEVMEVMFVKVKHKNVHAGDIAPLQAVKYDEWRLQQRTGLAGIHANALLSNSSHYRLKKVLLEAARGSRCFDCKYYRHNNLDVPSALPCSKLFKHWINYGQFEARPHRYTCDYNASAMLPLAVGSDGVVRLK